jgi:hypothetical protein
MQPFHQPDSISVPHDHVRQQQIKMLMVNEIKSFRAAPCLRGQVILAIKRRSQHGANVGLVIHDQYACR